MICKAVRCLQEAMNGADPKSFHTNDTFSVYFIALCLDASVFAF